MKKQSIEKEKQLVNTMIDLYEKVHQHDSDVPDGKTLKCYVHQRIEQCCYRHEQHKPFCNVCPIHCYKPDMRKQIRAVMRYSGPRMLLRHPFLSLAHLISTIHSKIHPPAKPNTR